MAIDIEAMYREYAPMVLRRCRKLLRDPEKAVDAMQDVFVNLLRAEHRLDGSRPASLLLRISTNVCLNLIRRDRCRPEDPDHETLLAIASAEEPENRNLARVFLGKWLGQEPESTRTMAVMHMVDGMTLDEVASEVGLSAAGVRKRLRQLRLRMNARAASEPAIEEVP